MSSASPLCAMLAFGLEDLRIWGERVWVAAGCAGCASCIAGVGLCLRALGEMLGSGGTPDSGGDEVEKG